MRVTRWWLSPEDVPAVIGPHADELLPSACWASVQVTPPEWPRKRISAVRYEVSAPPLGSRPSELCLGRTRRTRTHNSAVFGSHAAATCTAFVSALVHVLRYTLNASQESRNGSAAVVRRGLAPVSSTTGVDSSSILIL